jgi:hypothetical protein
MAIGSNNHHLFGVTKLVQVDAVPNQTSCKWMQYIPMKDGKQTKHTTMCETPKWQTLSEELPVNPHTNMSNSHHHTVNFHAPHYQKWVHLKYVFRISFFFNIHPGGGEDTLDIYCHTDTY